MRRHRDVGGKLEVIRDQLSIETRATRARMSEVTKENVNFICRIVVLEWTAGQSD